MSNEASVASCTNLYLHYDNTAAVDCEYVPAAVLAHFVIELDRKQPLLKQLYVPGILDTRNEKLYLLEDCPSATWNRISRRGRLRNCLMTAFKIRSMAWCTVTYCMTAWRLRTRFCCHSCIGAKILLGPSSTLGGLWRTWVTT